MYTRAVAITTSDTVALPGGVCKAIYVGGAGNVVVLDAFGNTTTFNGATAGSTLPIGAVRVNATLTTATNLVALY